VEKLALLARLVEWSSTVGFHGCSVALGSNVAELMEAVAVMAVQSGRKRLAAAAEAAQQDLQLWNLASHLRQLHRMLSVQWHKIALSQWTKRSGYKLETPSPATQEVVRYPRR